MINPRPKRDEITMFGEFKPSDVVLYLIQYPPIRPSDVIVEDEKRYIALQIQPVQRLGITIEQRVQMSLLHPDDEAYEKSIELITEPTSPDTETTNDFELIEA